MQKIKHISFAVFLISFGFSINAQNTIPTTTCTGALKVNDSLSVSKNITASGDITSTGEVVSKDTLRAQKDIIVDGNAKIAGDLYVNGYTTLNGLLTATKGINLDNSANSAISFSASTTGSTMNFGKILPYTPTCITPNTGNSNPTFVFSGFLSSKANNGLVNSVLNIGSAPWDGNGVIEVEGSDKFGGDGNALMINYFCGRNTLINTNNSLPNGGGTVFMGNQVSMANSARIGWDPNPIDLNSNLSIHTANGNAIKCITWNNGAKILTIVNGNFPKSPFTIYGDGKTRIGQRQPLPTGVHNDALLSVDGKIIATSVYITNAGGIWADYVFEKDYKKLSLDELNKFLLSQKHLPGIPTAKEIEKDGQDLGMNQIKLLEKIEESYLYIIELHKRIEALEKKNKEYENK